MADKPEYTGARLSFTDASRLSDCEFLSARRSQASHSSRVVIVISSVVDSLDIVVLFWGFDVLFGCDCDFSAWNKGSYYVCMPAAPAVCNLTPSYFLQSLVVSFCLFYVFINCIGFMIPVKKKAYSVSFSLLFSIISHRQSHKCVVVKIKKHNGV